MSNKWFPGGRYNPKGWRLDIISLLAVIGESSVATHAQEMTASWMCLLPRLIPAPQALLKSSRPRRLEPINANVIGVLSGSQVEELNFFANIIHDIDQLPQYAFERYQIKYGFKAEAEDSGTKHSLRSNHGNSKHGSGPQSGEPSEKDVEHGQEQLQKNHFNHSRSWGKEPSPPRPPPMVPPKHINPINAVSVLSCGLSVGAIIWAGVIEDGIALVAIAAISIASSMMGLGLWWNPILARRASKELVPEGDVIIRTRNGAFIYVKCNEQIARELYFGTEQCKYHVTNIDMFRGCSGAGTLLLMISVILLGNCSWTMQAVAGAIYLLLNLMYWATSLLEKKHFWNLDRYECKAINGGGPLFDNHAHEVDHLGNPPSFTRTLWYAIQACGETEWVKKSNALPETVPWQKWLKEAQDNIKQPDPKWDPVKAKDRLMREAVDGAYI